MAKKNPFMNEFKLTKERLGTTQSRVSENFKKGRLNLSDEKAIKNKLKKIRKLISEIEFQ